MHWFDIDVLNTIWNRDKYYKNSTDQARKLTKAFLNVQSFYLKK